MSASTLPIYGLPGSRKGLAFLHNVQLQDLIDLGLIRAETQLIMMDFPQGPTEAQITARGTIRLQDGREYNDPSKAAAEASFMTPGLAGQYLEDPHSETSASKPEKDLSGTRFYHLEYCS